jgi:hypothetical protein
MTAKSRCFGVVVLSMWTLAAIIPLSRSAAAQGGQQAGPAAWLQITMVEVDPANIDEYIALQRDYASRAKRNAPAARTVARVEVGANYGFLFITPMQNLAALDAAARNTNNDAELAALTARLQRYIKGQHNFVIRTIPEIDNSLPANQQPAVMIVNIAKVYPGREQDYLKVMKEDFLPHFNKANMSHNTGSLTFGGENGFVHLFYFANFAALDGGSPVVKALGAAGAQAVTGKLAGIVSGSEQWLARVLPDLSYPAARPAPTP